MAKMTAKKGYNLWHIEWKTEFAEDGKGNPGIHTQIDNSTLNFNSPSLPYMLYALGKDDESIARGIKEAAVLLENGGGMTDSTKEEIKRAMAKEMPALGKMMDILGDLIKTSKSGK